MKRWVYLFTSMSVILMASKAVAFDLSALAYQPNVISQDENGDEEKDPLSYGLTVGHQWNWAPGIFFAPRFSYVKNSEKSRDSYSDYDLTTMIVALDILYRIHSVHLLFMRFGIGNLIKEIKGPGGTVTIPNGSSTTTAYRPSGSSKSKSGTLNLGLDWRMGSSEMDGGGSWGGSLTFMRVQPIDYRKAYTVYLLNLGYYF